MLELLAVFVLALSRCIGRFETALAFILDDGAGDVLLEIPLAFLAFARNPLLITEVETHKVRLLA